MMLPITPQASCGPSAFRSSMPSANTVKIHELSDNYLLLSANLVTVNCIYVTQTNSKHLAYVVRPLVSLVSLFTCARFAIQWDSVSLTQFY